MVLAFCASSDDILSIYQVLFNSLLYLQRYAPDKLNIAEIGKGNNSINAGDRITVLAFCVFSDTPLLMFHLIPLYTFRDMLRTRILLQQ